MGAGDRGFSPVLCFFFPPREREKRWENEIYYYYKIIVKRKKWGVVEEANERRVRGRAPYVMRAHVRMRRKVVATRR